MAFKMKGFPLITDKKKKKRKKNKNNNQETEVYSGTMGKSTSRETAKKMWNDKASEEEKSTGYKLTQDAEGNYIVRTKQ